MHKGYMKHGTVPLQSRPGPLCQAVERSGSSNSLANLSLFPGRGEFYEYCPENTQSVILLPYGKKGCVVLGAATQRGFTLLDQAWLSVWIDKLVVALNDDE